MDFEQVISGGQVLVVKGALGAMGSGNTSVLMQLLVGMLDAALARRQDGIPAGERTAVALKIDEAPLVVNRGFAETLALKRSAGLETVACWQTDAQWIDRDVRAQLDALFAHRVYFATASVEDARRAANLMMAEFSDTVRPGIRNLSDLGRPDVRLHLPRHSALASWVTPEGRQAPFVAHTLPLPFDEQRLAFHAARQADRGGRFLEDLSQPHWLRQEPSAPVDLPEGSRQISELSGPVEPVQSAGSVESAGPANSAGPVKSTGPANSAGSVKSTGPANSAGPANIAGPANPAGSVESALSGKGSTSHPQSIESYTELVDLDAAHSVRWAKPATALLAIEPEPLDIEILALIGSMRHVLSSQIHRRFNPGRAATTTQRRLKRLADAGLVARFQFHRRDGGGVPMCYTITPAGLKLAQEQDTPQERESTEGKDLEGRHQRASSNDERLLRQARHEVHVVAWLLALQQALPNDYRMKLRGPEGSVIAPPLRSRQGERKMLSLAELSLPGGRTPHDFLRTLDSGVRVEVESFQTIRPDASICTSDGRELLVELDDRLPEGSSAAKLERYDHFISGWSVHLKRYKRSAVSLPTVVFVCRDGARARECARRADRILTACRAYPGEYPADWEYPGRERIFYAAERDIHHGSLSAWGLSRLPPEVRVVGASGDPRARDPHLERRGLEL
ncbi:MAG: replication-relaxation family protein [Solirubrobacteraceae bacterium]